MNPSPELFAEVLSEVQEALDWKLLGETYCHEGGESFFPPEQQAAITEAGLLFVTDVAAALEQAGSGGPRTSVYVGAGVAELLPILGETLVLGREVHALNLAGAETTELNRALSEVEFAVGQQLPRILTTPIESLVVSWDHLWLVSVLSDPETFPALSDLVYERGEPDAGEVERDSERALALTISCLRGAAESAVVTTTDEELPFIEQALEGGNRKLVIPERARLSAIVGDPVRHCLLSTA